MLLQTKALGISDTHISLQVIRVLYHIHSIVADIFGQLFRRPQLLKSFLPCLGSRLLIDVLFRVLRSSLHLSSSRLFRVDDGRLFLLRFRAFRWLNIRLITIILWLSLLDRQLPIIAWGFCVFRAILSLDISLLWLLLHLKSEVQYTVIIIARSPSRRYCSV